MSILFLRMDDITPTMHWDNFEYMRQMCKELNIQPIIGVVPENQDPVLMVNEEREDFWDIMRECQAEGWVIAQHGYQHVYETKDSGLLKLKDASEFAGLTYEVQYEKLRKGQEILEKEQLHATMFMAPGHTYDKNTLRALADLGFQSVTDGYAERPYRYKGLNFLPCKISAPKQPKAVDTICLHINGMKREDLEDVFRFVKKHRRLFVPVQDVLAAYPIRNRSILTAFVERKNLWMKRLKHRMAESAAMQAHLQRTQGKKVKRLLGLPGAMIKMLAHR